MNTTRARALVTLALAATIPLTSTAAMATRIRPITHRLDSKPVVYNARFSTRTGKYGHLSLTIDADGTYNYSGSAPAEKGRDLHVLTAVKDSDGSVIVFHYVESLTDGAAWDKQGTNDSIRDNFSSFRHAKITTVVKSHPTSATLERQYADEKGRRGEDNASHAKSDGGGGGGSSIWSDISGVLGTVGGTLLSLL